jgi:hypothetical protein
MDEGEMIRRSIEHKAKGIVSARLEKLSREKRRTCNSRQERE